MRLINCLTYAGILVLLAYHLMHYNITIGTFVAVYYSIEKLNVALANMFRDIGETMQDIETTSFLYDYLAEEDVKRRFDEYSEGQTIELRNVSFRYENTAYNAVNDINLIIRAGETVAIVGENGAGKSTLTKLIVGLYLPRSGVVLHGNRPTSSFALQALFKRQSAVFQDFVKYKMSLKENIRISDMSSKKAVDEVVSLTNIHINNLPNGMDTVLAREFGGTDVSGGEWKRIAIARGLYKESNIIILDEPTASIDPLEETRIFELFQNATIGKTTILVTHRIGSAKLANKIIVMENGNITEVGKHEELLQKRGLYYKLFQEQYQWYQR